MKLRAINKVSKNRKRSPLRKQNSKSYVIYHEVSILFNIPKQKLETKSRCLERLRTPQNFTKPNGFWHNPFFKKTSATFPALTLLEASHVRRCFDKLPGQMEVWWWILTQPSQVANARPEKERALTGFRISRYTPHLHFLPFSLDFHTNLLWEDIWVNILLIW